MSEKNVATTKPDMSMQQLLESLQAGQMEQLRIILEESRKPAPLTVAEKAKLEARNEERRILAEGGVAKAKAKVAEQARCSHVRGSGGRGRVVFVSDEIGGYLLCQNCNIRIRPEIPADKRLDTTTGVVYDANMFNALAQTMHQDMTY